MIRCGRCKKEFEREDCAYLNTTAWKEYYVCKKCLYEYWEEMIKKYANKKDGTHTCKNCKNWELEPYNDRERAEISTYNIQKQVKFGVCKSDKFGGYLGVDYNDTICYEVHGDFGYGSHVAIVTGEDFGCIHFKKDK